MIKVLVLLLAILNEGTSSSIFSESAEQNITDFVQIVMDCKHIPGLTLTVVKNGSVWTKGFGFADMDAGTRVTEDTLFGIGSLGKGFTMVLLGNLLKNTR